jgi:hypothetical protein
MLPTATARLPLPAAELLLLLLLAAERREVADDDDVTKDRASAVAVV